ncbi:MAG: respiratory nitrate reductase subunit gamma [Desulfomonile tiedjei]|nr:respiratory nitrate reductase subunit gamma [Desulfomonile tiedjei]
MDTWLNTLAFLIFPYVMLTFFVVGHAYRYLTDRFDWNSKSSELLEKESMRYAILLFHWGIIFTFLGHFFGLLTPQWLLDKVGITAAIHDFVAIKTGMLFGLMTLIGLILLLWRRVTNSKVWSAGSINDVVVVILLIFVVFFGTYNTFVAGYDVLNTIAPWIRSIVTFSPDPGLMLPVPWSYKIHILGAFAVLGFSPFSRLVHIWSVPVTYMVRPYLSFRRRAAGIP